MLKNKKKIIKKTAKTATSEETKTPKVVSKKPAAKKKQPSLYESYEALEKASLPDFYHETYVTLISKEPYTLYAYWEINGDDVDKIKREMGDLADSVTYTLRVFDVTLTDFNGYNANYWFDLDDLHMNQRYIRVGSDNATFVCEIGLRDRNGYFYPLARSNYVKAQRTSQSHRRDVIWKEVNNANEDDITFVNIKMHNRYMRGDLKPRANWQLHTARMILNPFDIRMYYEKHLPLLKLLLMKQKEEKKVEHKKIGDQNIEIEQTPYGGKVTITYEEIHSLGASEGFYIKKRKEEFPWETEKYDVQGHQRGLFPGASEGFYAHREGAFLGASEGFYLPKKKVDFPFEIEMILIVKGRTEPDAEVYMGSKFIPLTEEGTFTLQWPLMDGAMPFDFNAHSPKKGLSKSISTSVIRTQTKENIPN